MFLSDLAKITENSGVAKLVSAQKLSMRKCLSCVSIKHDIDVTFLSVRVSIMLCCKRF